MPLFCTLASAYTGENTPPSTTFENRGYPLMFETSKKHMFFVDPGDNKSTKTVHKFYGAPLSINHLGVTYSGGNNYSYKPINIVNGMGAASSISTSRIPKYYNIPLAFGDSFNVISCIRVNDHNIQPTFVGLVLPNETQLSIGESDLPNTKRLNYGSNFTIISDLDVNHHTILPKYKRFKLPTETKLSLNSSTSTISPLHGNSFTTISSISVSNHTITPNYCTVNLPESYLYATGCTINKPVGEQHFIKHKIGAKLKTKNESNDILLKEGNNISISCGTEYNDLSNGTVKNGHEIGNTITISATNTDLVKTQTTNNTVYLSGKNTPDDHIGTEYVNSNVYMINGCLYSKHFCAKVPNVGSWNANIEAALEITGEEKRNQTPIFRVKSANHKCQLELQETTGTLRLYRDSNYVEFPNKGVDGKLPISTKHNTNTVDKLVHDIRIVTALPSNAASYPNTLFLVTGGGNT